MGLRDPEEHRLLVAPLAVVARVLELRALGLGLEPESPPRDLPMRLRGLGVLDGCEQVLLRHPVGGVEPARAVLGGPSVFLLASAGFLLQAAPAEFGIFWLWAYKAPRREPGGGSRRCRGEKRGKEAGGAQVGASR